MSNKLYVVLAIVMVLLALAIVFVANNAAAAEPGHDELSLLFIGKVMIIVTAVFFFVVFFTMGLMIINAKERYRAAASELKAAKATINSQAVILAELNAKLAAFNTQATVAQPTDKEADNGIGK